MWTDDQYTEFIVDISEKIVLMERVGPDDPERGSVIEDDIHRAVLGAIASGVVPPGECTHRLARLALRTGDCVFPRWRA